MRRGRVCRDHPTPGFTQLFPRACRVQTPGWASPHPGRGGAPSAVPSPQRSRSPSSAVHTPAPAPCPRGQQEGCGRKAGQGPGLSCSETFLFPDVVVVATGDPTLPAAPGPSPQPLQLGFLPVRACVWWDDYRRGPGCQGGQERSGVSPTAGPGGSVSTNLLPLLVEV